MTLTTHPAFLPSLRALVETEGYSLRDIGAMFGVSGERVRQWCVNNGIERRRADRFRVWDDASARFVPIDAVTPRRMAVAERKKQRAARRDARKAEIVVRVRELRASLGREPSWAEIYLCISGKELPSSDTGAAMRVLSLWPCADRNTAERMADFRSATGLVGRARGGRGHIGYAYTSLLSRLAERERLLTTRIADLERQRDAIRDVIKQRLRDARAEIENIERRLSA